MAVYPEHQPGQWSLRVLHYVVLIAVGIGATLALAFSMHTLIYSSEMSLSKSEQVRMLDFVRLKREEVVERKRRKPERPQLQEAPEVPPAMEQAATDSGETLAVFAPTAMDVGVDIARSGIGLGTGDGEYLPIVKVAPIYPRRALERGLDGTCLVRYTVTTSGTVRNVEVVPGYCTDPIFERPSVEAARRFKYKPRVIDGTPVEVPGVQNMFHFERVKNQ